MTQPDGPYLTRGARAVARAFADGLKQADLAEETGIAQNTLSGIARGTSKPGAFHQDLLAAALGIPREWWLTTEQRARIKRVRSLGKPCHAAAS